jgi:hypothetical protein
MTDPNNNQPVPPAAPAEPAQAPAQPPAQPKPEPEPGPVPYDRFREVNEKLKNTETRLAEMEAAAKTAAEKELAAQNKWRELAEKREAELKQERLERLRLTVATSKGLPLELATRLQGEDQAALEADAEAILQYLKPSSGPGVPPPGRKQQSAALDMSTMTPDEIRKNKAKLLTQM